MSLKYLVILAHLLLLSQSAVCQKKNKTGWSDGSDDLSAMPKNIDLARFQINDIKLKGIIVRLKTDKDRIAAYRKIGRKQIADEIENKDKGINLLLMYAFITQWSYSPVYFMESQYSSKLMQQDTLIAKTFDLRRDTAIYMNRDSFYILDYGELMTDGFDGDHPLRVCEESNTPKSGLYLVIKDHTISQLHPPMPFHSKIWTEGFASMSKMELLNISPGLNDNLVQCLNKYTSITEMIKSESKATVQSYMDTVYDHIYTNLMGNKKSRDSSYSILGSSAFANANTSNSGHLGSTQTIINTYDVLGDMGATLIRGTKKLNTFFISYYCIRLDKDKNILCRDDLPYWWQRNPNIRYLPHLRQLETELKEYIKNRSNPTK